MSKWFTPNIGTPPSSLTKRKPPSGSLGYSYYLDLSSTTASSRRGSSSPVPRVTSAQASLQLNSARQPYSQTEVYWATRALRSEALLVAQATHHNEVRGILSSAEIKRAREISELRREHNARHSRLEAVAIGLFVSLLLLAIVVFYLVANFSRQRTPETTRWGLPHHFTIPVLSPFTSVVESESAVIGARSIAVLIVVSGAVIYGLIRYWMDHSATK